MNRSRRGLALSIFAILFALLAISNFAKAIHPRPGVGLVFLGVRTSGSADLILGILFGIILVLYAIGIWRMKRYAMVLGYAYFVYVVVNLILFAIRNEEARNGSNPLFGYVYVAIAAGLTLASPILLTRRGANLS